MTSEPFQGEPRAPDLEPPALRALVSMAVLDAIYREAVRMGLLVPDVLAPLRESSGDSDRRAGRLVAQELEELLWAALSNASPDPALAVRLAQRLERGTYGALEYLARASATVGEALDRCVALQRSIHGHRVFELDQAGKLVVLTYRSPHPESPELAPYGAELALASLVIIGRNGAESDWAPARVELMRERPRDRAPFEAVFGSHLVFGSPVHRVTLARETLAIPMRDSDPKLAAILDSFIVDELGRMPERALMTHAVAQVLGDVLAGGEPRLGEVAARLGLSGRALQRRLQAEGSSYRAVLDRTRLALARRYLQDERLTVSAVAALLGYSEPSAFHRGFRRWTGSSPHRYRRELRRP